MTRKVLFLILSFTLISCGKSKENKDADQLTGTLFDIQTGKATTSPDSMYGLWQSSEQINEDTEVSFVKRLSIDRRTITIAKKCYDPEDINSAVYVQVSVRASNSNEKLQYLENARNTKEIQLKGVEERCRVRVRKQRIVDFDVQAGSGGTAILRKGATSTIYFKVGN